MMRTAELLRALRVVLGIAVICSFVGCSGGNCSVSGTVSYDGTPIEKGNIRLHPTSDIGVQGASADIINGKYEIPIGEGLIDGEYTVMISATRPATAEEIAAMEAANAGEEEEEEEEEEEGAAPQPPVEPMMQYIPAQYNQGSTLRVQLEPGENTQDFALEKVAPIQRTGSDADED